MFATKIAELSQDALIDAALAWLGKRLPSAWQVTRTRRIGTGTRDVEIDTAIDVVASNGMTSTIVVEARSSFSARDAESLLSGITRTLRALSPHIPVMVVAPWLSQRTRELLVANDVSYIDLTGNARVRLENPALYLEAAGASRNPAPAASGAAVRLRGPKAGRLLRLLADVAPPYGVSEVAAASGLTRGYVSRLLDALDRETLIDRDRRGSVRAVDAPAVLRRWAESYDVFRANEVAGYFAPAGPAAMLDQLGALENVGRLVVTGSFAASKRAPVTAPALLAAYCDDAGAVAEALRLLPAETGANIVLLQPFDPVVWVATSRGAGVTYASVSQVAVDCLTGNGRMPAEGEALLRWMSDDEKRWQTATLHDFAPLA